MNLSDAKSLSNRRTGDGMVEVLEFVVPLHTGIMHAIVLQGLVDRSEVLQATHRSNKLMSRLNNIGVVETDSERVPTLLDFGVGVISAVILGINFHHDWDIYLGLSENKLILEDNLKVGVEIVVVNVVGRSTSSVKGNISVSHCQGFISDIGSEVKRLGR